jgi:hypothetical protein
MVEGHVGTKAEKGNGGDSIAQRSRMPWQPNPFGEADRSDEISQELASKVNSRLLRKQSPAHHFLAAKPTSKDRQ